MPVDVYKLLARSRTVEIDGVGPLVFREPTLADVQRASVDPFWWVACVTCPDGTPFLADPKDAGKIRSDLAGLLMEEINRTRPTPAPKGASGESPITAED
jgi:hypothetical protein